MSNNYSKSQMCQDHLWPKVCSLSPFRSSDLSLGNIYLGFVILQQLLLRNSIMSFDNSKLSWRSRNCHNSLFRKSRSIENPYQKHFADLSETLCWVFCSELSRLSLLSSRESTSVSPQLKALNNFWQKGSWSRRSRSRNSFNVIILISAERMLFFL